MINTSELQERIEARRAYEREWRRVNAVEIAARRKARYEANRTKPPRSRQSHEELKAKQRAYYAEHAEELREKAGVNRLKLSLEKKQEYNRRGKAAYRIRRDQKLAEIAGRPRALVCEIPGCGKTGAGRSTEAKTVFDHDHRTGAFRGWLCNRCNVVAGLAEDDPQVLREIAVYLERHKEKEINGSIRHQSPR